MGIRRLKCPRNGRNCSKKSEVGSPQSSANRMDGYWVSSLVGWTSGGNQKAIVLERYINPEIARFSLWHGRIFPLPINWLTAHRRDDEHEPDGRGHPKCIQRLGYGAARGSARAAACGLGERDADRRAAIRRSQSTDRAVPYMAKQGPVLPRVRQARQFSASHYMKHKVNLIVGTSSDSPAIYAGCCFGRRRRFGVPPMLEAHLRGYTPNAAP